MTSRPIVGAAMQLDALEIHRDWILEKQRDLELQDFTTADVLGGDWSGLAARAKKLLDGYTGRLGIHGPFWGLTLASHDPEIRQVVNRRLKQGLEVCAAIGATQMVIHSPYSTWSYHNLDNNPGESARLIEHTHATLGDTVRRAADMGCTMVLENIEDKDPHVRCALVDSFASPAIAVSIDTGHAHYAHGSTGAPPVDYYVHAAGNRLQHVHLQDADGYADRHWAIGEGSIRWHSVFAALSALGSNPRLILELRQPQHIRSSAAYLESLGLVE
ncbi:sugar phosphate isomerase/epimerase family protein [Aquamicrobium sp. LC103]|uniref:sugar phosphate isomerase/epimerase family protein n=1 Tax=Aquamicrobium sp. LC103 TaxID=1120658 RepID=UPI00063E7025|nr:sugar phosphate isomerase/epimerase family protein [Aquamicrobium sp. LC103]TKT74391.1 sugar phosphate isomerase/epimerase [Aquamicrobium sp. LC103]